VSFLANDKHRTTRLAHQVFGHRTQKKALESDIVMSSDDEQIRVQTLAQVQDFGGRFTEREVAGNLGAALLAGRADVVLELLFRVFDEVGVAARSSQPTAIEAARPKDVHQMEHRPRHGSRDTCGHRDHTFSSGGSVNGD
jgi:hypothetical protein